MVTHPTSTGLIVPTMQPSRGRVRGAHPRAVTVFCSEALRATACVVVDALMVRGYRVALRTGRDARGELRRSVRDSLPTLRVLCLSETVDGVAHTKLQQAFDPDQRGDLLIVTLVTPMSVIRAIENATGAPVDPYERRLRRTVLAHPTLVERKLEVRRFASAGLGVLVASVLLVVGLPWLLPELRSTRAILIRGPGPQVSMHQAAGRGLHNLMLPGRLADDDAWMRDPMISPDDIIVDDFDTPSASSQDKARGSSVRSEAIATSNKIDVSLNRVAPSSCEPSIASDLRSSLITHPITAHPGLTVPVDPFETFVSVSSREAEMSELDADML